MAGKEKHKSRSRKTYRGRMCAASYYLNNNSLGRGHAKRKGSFILALIEAMKAARKKKRREKA